jgi:hypothetical protein
VRPLWAELEILGAGVFRELVAALLWSITVRACRCILAAYASTRNYLRTDSTFARKGHCRVQVFFAVELS